MSDKTKAGIAVIPEFVDGETVRAAKLNALGSQLQRAASQLERAVGDLHDESYPYSSLNAARLSLEWGRSMTSDAALASTATRSLDIANLARLIGPASNLNPSMATEPGVGVVENVPAGVYEFSLQFPETAISSSTDTAVVNLVADSSLLVTTGDYCIGDGGRVATYSATSGGTVTYLVTPSAWGSGPNYTGARFNVIPDPNQLEAGGAGCTVSGSVDSQARHTITLPVVSHLSRNIGGTATATTTADPIHAERIFLPRILTDNYSSEEVIPSGFLYLKNWTTGEVYKDAVYYYSNAWTLLVGGVDLADEVAAGDKFIVVTVGTDITSSIDDLRSKFASHNHDRSRGEMPIDASNIVGWVAEAGGSGRFTLSQMPGNFAPQYLHRDGYDATESDLNDRNVMRGDLVMGLGTASPGGYHANSAATKGLYFGTKIGPYLKKTSATDFTIANPLGDVFLDADFYVATGNQQVLLQNASTYQIVQSPTEFVLSTATGYYGSFGEHLRVTGTGIVLIPTPWRLPDEATITGITLWYMLGDAGDRMDLDLYRTAISTGTGSVMAGLSVTGGIIRSSQSDLIITDPILDYGTYSYHAQINITTLATELWLYGLIYTFETNKMGN